MLQQRLLASTLAASVGLAFFATPAIAQPAPSPQASAMPAPMQSSPASRTPMQSTPASQPQSAVPPLAADAQALPPPPQPAILPPVPPIATDYTPPKTTAPAADLVGLNQTPFVGIKLDDAVTMALQKNTDLAIAQSNQRISNYQIVAAQGAYDVKFQLVPSFQHSVSAPTSLFEAGPNFGPITQDTAGATAQFTGQTGSGGTFTAGTSAQRLTTNSTIDSFNPQYTASLNLMYTQPLLRGTGVNETKRQILLAQAGDAAQKSAALVSAAGVIANVSDTYWDLVAAWRDVAIQEQGLRNAQAQANSSTRLAGRGNAAPVDIVETNTQVNVFQDNVLSALLNVQRLQNQLKGLILSSPADPTWMANLVPTTNVALVPNEPKLDDLIVSALVNRPEIAQLRAQRQTVNANLAYAKDQLKPQVDLSLGYQSNGFAGNPTDPTANPIFGAFGPQIVAINQLIARANAASPNATPLSPVGFSLGSTPSYLNGKYNAAYQNLFDNRFPTYTVSLTIQLPLRNRTAKAQYDIAQEQGKQIEVQELALIQRVRSEATLAIQTLRSAQYRLIAAHDARLSAERVLLGEQRRFSAGASTTFLVLQRGLDVANQQGRELQAQTDLNKAVVELNRVAGTIFTSTNVDASSLGATTLNTTSPTTSALPSPAPAAASPQPARR